MSAILEGTPDKKLALVTGRAYPEQAQETAKYLGTDVLETTAYDFANGEMYVRYTEPVRGADAFVMQAHTEPINKWIMEQLIMVDAMKHVPSPWSRHSSATPVRTRSIRAASPSPHASCSTCSVPPAPTAS